jgi:hypothetical protein
MRMQNGTAAELVSAWEQSLGQPLVHQALALLSIAEPQSSSDQLAQLSIGERDARLLALRERLFGPTLTSLTECPDCRQGVELTFNVAAVKVAPERAVPGDSSLAVSLDGYHVQFRLPNSVDLSTIDMTTDPDRARETLLHRCIASVRRADTDQEDDASLAAAVLPETVVRAIAERMSEVDAQAEAALAVCCPDCGHRWEAVFDIAAYLAEEVHNFVGRLLREVDVLARAYGWRESDILAMTPIRRRAYIGLLGRG